MKNTYRVLVIAFILLVSIPNIKANNVIINNLTVTGASPGTNFTLNFNIAWYNSWYLATTPFNWDAVWVFIKYKDCDPTNFTWLHAIVDAAGHTAAAPLQVDVPSDFMGVFIRRSATAPAQGNIASTAITLNITVPNGSYDFKVFGIEMVYVPQGDFLVGDNTNSPSPNGFLETTIDNNYENITPIPAITIGGGAPAQVPVAYPLGWEAFYCMKYEITTEQYVDFLNTLIYTQQATRTTVAPNSAVCTRAYGNNIAIQTTGISTTNPAVYASDANVNCTYNEAADGQNSVINSMSWGDLAAYLDWAALRPMSDFEFEKACRGTDPRISGEFAGGNILFTAATGPSNPYASNEISSTSGNGLMNYVTGGIGRPIRAGFGATATSTRLQSSTSFYGICDLSGNVWERVVTISNASGLSFTGILGNGALMSPSGDANAVNWPVSSGLGAGFRGGAYNTGITTCRVSDRTSAGLTDATRGAGYGGRGVRNY